MNRRVLFAALLLSLASSAWLAFQPDEAETDAMPVATSQAPPLARPSEGASRRATRPVQAWPALPKPRDPAPWPLGADALAAWQPLPPPPAPPPAVTRAPDTAPAAQSAPVFPYQLIGRVEGEGQTFALLNGPLRTLSVKAQDTIDSQWRVEAVLPTGVSLLWLPSGQKQTLLFRPS